jgi:hypothetical protein
VKPTLVVLAAHASRIPSISLAGTPDIEQCANKFQQVPLKPSRRYLCRRFLLMRKRTEITSSDAPAPVEAGLLSFCISDFFDLRLRA